MNRHIYNFKTDPVATLSTGLIFLFPVGMAIIRSWASSFFLVLLLLCLFIIWKDRQTQHEGSRLLLWAMGLFLAVAALSLVNADDMHQSVKRLGKLSAFLLFIPLYLGSVRLKRDLSRPLLLGSMVASLVMAATAFYTFEILDYPRAKGAYHPIIFGDLSMLCALFGVSAMVTGVVGGRWRYLLPVCIVAALYASILSGTRGALVALPLTGILFLWLYRRRLKRKKAIVIFVAVSVLFLASPFLFPDTIGAQVKRTYNSCVEFVEGQNRNSSLGQRFLMWNIAIDMWKESPILGSGLGDFRHDALEQMALGKTALSTDHGHAHNIIFEYLGATGLLGTLAMIIALFVLPFREFYRHWNRVIDTSEAFVPLAGMTLLAAFFAFGLSEGWLARSAFIKSYVVCLVVFLSALSKGEGSVSR